MCGRYSNHVKAMLDWTALLGDWPGGVEISHNIAPTQTIAGFTREGGAALRWGLIPVWSKEISAKYATFNARIETVAEKPAFRRAWKQGSRCLIPALGYYEWQKGAAGKQPFFIHDTDAKPLLFAGLYAPAREPDFPASCTVLTREAQSDLAHIHPRMPVMIDLDSTASWFDIEAAEAQEWLESMPGPGLTSHPVSRRVNNARNEGDDLIEPLAESPQN